MAVVQTHVATTQIRIWNISIIAEVALMPLLSRSPHLPPWQRITIWFYHYGLIFSIFVFNVNNAAYTLLCFLFNIRYLKSVHLSVFILFCWVLVHCVNIIRYVYQLSYWWTTRLFAVLGYPKPVIDNIYFLLSWVNT